MTDEQDNPAIDTGIARRLASGWGPAERDGSRPHRCGFYIEDHRLSEGEFYCPKPETKKGGIREGNVSVTNNDSVECPSCHEEVPVSIPLGDSIWRTKDRALLNHSYDCNGGKS